MPVKEKVESILFNGAVVIGPDGELLGDYRKLHLQGEERLAFRPGYRTPIFETEFGGLGVMIGWDMAFPEVARGLALDGADLIVAPSAWMSDQMEPWRAYAVARACENAIYIAAANRVGKEPSYTFGGESMLVGPRGQVHTCLEDAVEGYAVATVDLDEIRAVREESQIFQCRQPAAYRALVRKY
jgi:predicted amidohydrolase